MPAPHFAHYPLTDFTTLIPVVFLVLMCLLEKQDPDSEPENNYGCAYQVREQVRISVEDRFLEDRRPVFGGVCENTAKARADDGAKRSGQRLQKYET